MKHFMIFWAAMLLANATIMVQKMYITINGRTETAGKGKSKDLLPWDSLASFFAQHL